jgi:branched-chain amino acid transport system ATP-binding protein
MRGRITFTGKDITGKRSDRIAQLGISQVPEGRRLFRGLTVEENLRLGAYSRRGKSRRELDESLEAVFARFPRLRERRRQIAGTMSGGEQQMCAIGRALMAKPRLIMIDELSLGLAPVIVEELVQILRDIRDSGTTILLVEQDVSVALGVSERAIVLRTGQVAMEGFSSDLLSDEEIVRTYLGG